MRVAADNEQVQGLSHSCFTSKDTKVSKYLLSSCPLSAAQIKVKYLLTIDRHQLKSQVNKPNKVNRIYSTIS